jgi:hypothetical protein
MVNHSHILHDLLQDLWGAHVSDQDYLGTQSFDNRDLVRAMDQGADGGVSLN